jgi:hypothetical protein
MPTKTLGDLVFAIVERKTEINKNEATSRTAKTATTWIFFMTV